MSTVAAGAVVGTAVGSATLTVRREPERLAARLAMLDASATIAAAAPAAATSSVRSEIQIQSPGYQPNRRIQRRRSDGQPCPSTMRKREPALEAVALIRLARGAAARARASSAAAIARSRSSAPARHQASGAGSMTVSSEALAASPASGSSDRPQFGQKCEPRRIGAPQTQRGARAARVEQVSISARRASIPTIAGGALGEQVVAEAAAPVHLDEQPAELAQRVLARLAAAPGAHGGAARRRRRLWRRAAAAHAAFGGGDDVRRVATSAGRCGRARRRLERLELQNDETLFGHLAHSPGRAFLVLPDALTPP